MKNKSWEILYEDEYLMAINKSGGLLTIPDRYDENKPNLLSALRKTEREVFVVHRLDRDTSGVILFAKDAETHKILNDGFSTGQINKTYHAFVKGVPSQDEYTISGKIGASDKKKGKVMISGQGKSSTTLAKILKRWKDYSLIECIPITGRQHQIRIHLQSIGYPLLVDSLYGTESEFKISRLKRKKKFHLKKATEERPLVSRHTLHAMKTEFTHPMTNKKMSFEAVYPKDLRALTNQLNKLNEVISK